MSSRLAELREKSKRRKEYLKVTLGVDNLSEALGSDKAEPVASRRRLDSDKEAARCQEFTEKCLLRLYHNSCQSIWAFVGAGNKM